MVTNPNYYSQSTTSTFNQIEDGVDFPHTGIIKSLSDGLGQNYAISDFDITIDSATQIDVGAGVIFRDGKKVSISAVNNLALGRTTANENSYHLVVVNSSDAIVIRSPSAKDKVPDYTAGDTIIAVVTHNGNNPMPIQYLTVNKTEHSLSVGRNNSGYTEGLTIQSNAGDIEIEAKESDKDIIFKVNDSDGGGAGQEVMRIDASTQRVTIGEITGSQGTADRNLNLIGPDAVMRIARTSAFSPSIEFLQLSVDGNTRSAYWDIYVTADRFSIRDRQSGDINVFNILESNQSIGIGTETPSSTLHVKSNASGEPKITIENTNADDQEAQLEFRKNSASPASGDDLGIIRFVGEDSLGSAHLYSYIMADSETVTAGAEEGRISFYVSKAGATQPVLNLNHDEVVINENSNDVNFRVESDTNANMLLVDAGLNRIGIGTSSPAATVDVHGDLRVTNNIYQQYKDMTNNLSVGWHTVAHIKGRSGGSASGTGGSEQRGIAQVIIKEESSSRHALYEFKLNHLFGVRNAIQMENTAYYSTNIIQQVRIKENDTYDGAVFQVYVADATNNLQVYITDNFADAGWTVNDAVADADNSGHDALGLGYNNAYSTFSVSKTYNLDNIDGQGTELVDGGTLLGGNTFISGSLTVQTGKTFSSTRLPMVSVSASTTLAESTHAGKYLKCAGNVTLPSTSAEGEHYTILNTTGGNITVSRNGNSINGASADITVATFDALSCIAIGNNDWIAIG